MPTTQTDIANEALDLVGAATIVSLNDPTPEAGIVARALGPTMARVLQSYPWAFATTRATLDFSVDAQVGDDAPTRGAIAAFPDDALRIISVGDGCHNPWRIEHHNGGQAIVLEDASAATQADVAYVVNITDPDQMPPLVRELIAYELAIKVAAKLTESPQRIAALTRKAIQARKLAQSSDAKQNAQRSPERATSELWADQMGGGL